MSDVMENLPWVVRYEDDQLYSAEFRRARAAIESMNPANYMAERAFRDEKSARRYAATKRGALVSKRGAGARDEEVVGLVERLMAGYGS